MKLDAEFIKKIIEEDNPVQTVGRKLLDLWLKLAETENGIGYYYDKGEEEAKAFEEFVSNSYFEFYVLLARACLQEKTVFDKFLNSCIIIMDGMSFRESALLYKTLQKKGFKVDHGFNYSSVPSDTELFRKKIEISIDKFAQINNPKQVRLRGDEKYIWSYFPDVMLATIKTGHTVISSLEEMYKIIEEIILKIVNHIEAEKIIITSDHGYIRTEAGYVFSVPEKAKRKLQATFGSNRYVKIDNLDLKELIEDGYVEEFNGYYVIKSRYSWPVPGKYSIYIHGGLSLMECFVPVLEVGK